MNNKEESLRRELKVLKTKQWQRQQKQQKIIRIKKLKGKIFEAKYGRALTPLRQMKKGAGIVIKEYQAKQKTRPKRKGKSGGITFNPNFFR